jgi:hypothetical protein
MSSLYRDADFFDRALDDYAVDDPYATTWEPVDGLTHVTVSSYLTATTAEPARPDSSPAGRPAETTSSLEGAHDD